MKNLPHLILYNRTKNKRVSVPPTISSHIVSYIEPEVGDFSGEIEWFDFSIMVRCIKTFHRFSEGKLYECNDQDRDYIWISDDDAYIAPVTYNEFEECFALINEGD